ncbi:MAG: DUF4331 domain-containing protein [Planctomycetota bacterium]
MKRIARSILGASAVVAALLSASTARASSHREAPHISKDPAADGTDLYAFRSLEDPRTAVLIMNYSPFELPYGGPNFYGFGDQVVYKFKIDTNGDSVADIVYSFDFTTEVRNPGTFLYNTGPVDSLQDADLNVRQFYRVSRIDRNGETILGKRLIVAPAYVGTASMPDYDSLSRQAIYTLNADPDKGDTKVFCGPRDDGFYADLGGLFDLLTIRDPPGDQGGGVDGLAGLNVLSICLQIPIADLEGPNNDHIIGVWATASRPKTLVHKAGGEFETFGRLVQVSRLGMPLVNEAVIPMSLKNHFNNSTPKGDQQFLGYVTDPELAGLLSALYGISVPGPPRTDLVKVFLTGIAGLNQPTNVVAAEMLRVNLSTQPANPEKRLGVLAGDIAGFPNGRRVGDDVVDIALRVVAGVLFSSDFDVPPNNRLGDGVDANDVPFLTVFPFLAPPHPGIDATAR